jgi:cytochrome c biogenesis protein
MTTTQSSKSIFSEVIDFFASVKLALVLLIVLAITSILGTVLPQEEPLGFYQKAYSPLVVKLIGFFQLYDMYHSWWFQWLLFLLSVNLIVCSLKRFSTTWKVIMAPPRGVSESLFESLSFKKKLSLPENPLDDRAYVSSLLGNRFGKPVSLTSASGKAFYLEKGRFSRLGVYVVHLSVLIIFAGAIVGSFFGFKGFLELREGESRDRIVLKGAQEIKQLDFSVKLDQFALSFYPNGMPKEYRSDLSFWEKGKEKEKAVVMVNDPFTYKGITFYQSSWDQYPLSIKLALKREGRETELLIPMEKKTAVPATPFSLQAVRYVNNLSNLGPALGIILFKDLEKVDQSWILADHPQFHGNRLGDFHLTVKGLKTRYVSGLQVNQDPGIWFIWIGSSLMLIGFVIAFYFSHQQVWIWIRETKDHQGETKTDVLIGATAHKNRGALNLKMEQLTRKV